LTETVLSPTIRRQTELKKHLTITQKGIIMSKKSAREKTLTLFAEMRLIQFVLRMFPVTADITCFCEIHGGKPGFYTYSWRFDTERRLHVRPSWRTGKLHIEQTLTSGDKNVAISFPVKWGGLNIVFDKEGKAVLDGDAARNFWEALIGHNGEGIPKPGER
jgi:hypothetical protein